LNKNGVLIDKKKEIKLYPENFKDINSFRSFEKKINQ
jgi:hypothetical protein